MYNVYAHYKIIPERCIYVKLINMRKRYSIRRNIEYMNMDLPSHDLQLTAEIRNWPHILQADCSTIYACV